MVFCGGEVSADELDPGPQCFKMITVQANGVTVGGVQIMGGYLDTRD